MLVELSYNMGLSMGFSSKNWLTNSVLRHLLGDPCQNCAGTNVDASWQGGKYMVLDCAPWISCNPKRFRKTRTESIFFCIWLYIVYIILEVAIYIYILYTCIYLTLFNLVSLRSAVSKPEEKSQPGLFSWIISGCSWGLVFQDLSEFSDPAR